MGRRPSPGNASATASDAFSAGARLAVIRRLFDESAAASSCRLAFARALRKEARPFHKRLNLSGFFLVGLGIALGIGGGGEARRTFLKVEPPIRNVFILRSWG